MAEVMNKKKLPPVMLFTEATPNPETLKFVTNRMIFKGTADFPDVEWAQEWSPMATELFEKPYVKGVFICNNFVTITKDVNTSWYEVKIRLKNWIMAYLNAGKVAVKDGFIEAQAEKKAKERADVDYSVDDAIIINKIEELLETHIKTGVASHGGNIELKSYKDGVVYVTMEGACGGCPSSTVTLKAGIENLLKREIPQVIDVRAETEE